MDLEHPGVVLKKYYLTPRGIGPSRMARDLGIHRTTAWRLLNGYGGITPDIALRLSRYLGQTAGFWQGMQTEYEIAMAEPLIRAELDRVTPFMVEINTGSSRAPRRRRQGGRLAQV